MTLKWSWNLGMMVHSIEWLWRWIWPREDGDFWYKTDGWVRMRYHSNFESTPTIPKMGTGLTRNLCALVWVPSKQASSGLGWRLPLPQKKWCDMTWMRWIVRPKPCAVPRLTVCLHWEAKLMGRGAYTRVCKWKVMVDDPRTELWLFRVILTDVIKCCGTSVRPLQSVELFE